MAAWGLPSASLCRAWWGWWWA
ncbi:hypothetical protein E2C01_090293 [Portunus trituberculatus]|uniref:Uncharacterized protein n=1 Tax=Portunus trituberculatus TaxID=210409 RepID=A0A5B7JPS4_PORTR|nr:hypothetical protein [Portunus trituberculatus]